MKLFVCCSVDWDVTAPWCTEMATYGHIQESNPLDQDCLMFALLFFVRINKHRIKLDIFFCLIYCRKIRELSMWKDVRLWPSLVCLFCSFFFCPWSPPETKDSTIDSPDAQRQEWFAQYFSFWLIRNLQNTRI